MYQTISYNKKWWINLWWKWIEHMTFKWTLSKLSYPRKQKYMKTIYM